MSTAEPGRQIATIGLGVRTALNHPPTYPTVPSSSRYATLGGCRLLRYLRKRGFVKPGVAGMPIAKLSRPHSVGMSTRISRVLWQPFPLAGAEVRLPWVTTFDALVYVLSGLGRIGSGG
jgi:hypothetical protein